MIEGEDDGKDPAEVIGDNVAATVGAVQDDAAAAVAEAERKAIDAAATAEHIAAAARESAIAHDVGEKHREIDEWRAGLESRFQGLEQTVATLPETMGETLRSSLDQLRADLSPPVPAASIPPQTSQGQDPNASLESPKTEPGAGGSPAGNEDPPQAPRKRRHVL